MNKHFLKPNVSDFTRDNTFTPLSSSHTIVDSTHISFSVVSLMDVSVSLPKIILILHIFVHLVLQKL